MTPLFFSSPDCQLPVSVQAERVSQWQIRSAKPDDVSGIAEVIADSFHSREGIFGWTYPLLRLGIYEDICNRLRSTSPHHICLIAAVATTEASYSSPVDKVAGIVEMAVRSIPAGTSLGYSTHRPCRAPYLSNLAVHPQQRRQGVAKQLLLSCERIALTWGFNDLYLHVLENNLEARQLYFNLGYQLHQVDTNWSNWLLGRPQQMLLHKHISTITVKVPSGA